MNELNRMLGSIVDHSLCWYAKIIKLLNTCCSIPLYHEIYNQLTLANAGVEKVVNSVQT